MRIKNFALGLACALLAALPALSQIPTGTLSGRVGTEKQTLPGVTVTVSSPSLQGSRTATSNGNGDYSIPLLPPGEYRVTFEVEGFQKSERTVKVSAAQDTSLDVTMALKGVSEEITITGSADTAISTTPTSSTTYSKKFIEDLPVQRNVTDTVLLTPGVTANGPSGSITISGAQSYESLFLVNGVVVNENLRGQPLNLFIEDAIEETTTSTSGISSEYGRFSGGVVNTVTKSGGNEIHGSLRDSLTNDKWTAPTPVTAEHSRIDKNNPRYEGTLGGWLLKDRLWYFAAGRQLYTDTAAQTAVTHVSYPNFVDEQREEGKLTLSPFQGQRLIASYININHAEANVFGTVLDLASVNDRKLPETLRALNYTGVISDNFFLEGQYSKREFTFENAGSQFTDLIQGTLLVDGVTGFRWNSPTFCGVCRPEQRNNENYLGKASWFVSTPSAGTHDLSFGYDYFNDIRVADNHQSGSDFRIFVTQTLVRGTSLFPQILGDESAVIQWNPIPISSEGTNFKTDSAYANDKWRLNDRVSFNLGVRYDKNDGANSLGQKVAKDSSWSPRLGGTYDLKGDGDFLVNASYAKYVDAIANSQADSTSSAGNPSTYQFFYTGPDINANASAANLTPAGTAIQQVFNWFNSVGGTNNQSNLFFVSIPGGTTVIRGSLDSPSTTEYSVGIAKRLGTRGLVRADVVHRNSADFYFARTDLTTGKTTTPTGAPADLGVLENNSGNLERKYDGLHTQIQYRVMDRLSLGGTYTLSWTKGNVNGETVASGPVSSTDGQFPEYKQASWNDPKGYLLTDQRHRLRAWAIYDIWKHEHNQLNASLLQSYYTGTPYGAVGAVDDRAFVQNPGYVIPPARVTYYYTARDAFRTSAISSTDLSLNYSFLWNAFDKSIELFLQPEILNVFNRDGILTPNVSIQDSTTTASLAKFNPFTTTPVEGVNWRKTATFGHGVNPTDFQTPRTFRFSLGFRF